MSQRTITIPNVHMQAQVPADFPEEATRLGISPVELLWRLAEDLCARRPEKIEVEVIDRGETVSDNLMVPPATTKEAA